MVPKLSEFARGLRAETAFTVLASAKKLKASGKDVVELEIGDSPFTSAASAIATAVDALQSGQTRYCPSGGLPGFRSAAADFVRHEFGIPAQSENIVAAHGAKIFETFFCETFVEPGDTVLLFSPYFPTYIPNIQRRGAKVRVSPLKEQNDFRPSLDDIEQFLEQADRPRAIFLNSPHNPTGGVATKQDLEAIANLIRGRDVAVFSDEPYCHMVWSGKHHSLLAEPDMLDQCIAAFTFSKSYSMSGWRLGFAVAAQPVVEVMDKMVNTALSCEPPFVQLAGQAALQGDAAERDRNMQQFQRKVQLLTKGLRELEDVTVVPPGGTFYVFPNVMRICNRLGITSHGLALYLLQAADDNFGVACLGGECFGEAGRGFLRFSCAEPDDRIAQALAFLPRAWKRTQRVSQFLEAHPEFALREPYGPQ